MEIHKSSIVSLRVVTIVSLRVVVTIVPLRVVVVTIVPLHVVVTIVSLHVVVIKARQQLEIFRHILHF